MAKRLSKQLGFRFKVIRIIFVLVFIGIFIQLFNIQILKHEAYERKAIGQQTQDTAIQPKRGSILDRNGNELAISASAYMVTMSPSVIGTDDVLREKITDGLSSCLNMDRDKIYQMTLKNVQYLEVARRIEKDQMDLVNEFIRSDDKYSGIVHIAEDPKRYYPHGNLLSTVIGFVGTDNQGLEGVETMYDSYLKGSPGKVIVAKNAKGTAMPFEYEKYIPAEDGADITLTIDIEMQYFLEKHIDNARVEHNVQNRVAGIIMDVKTGEVLAMSTKPDFDPNEPFIISDDIVLKGLAQYTGDEYITEYNKMVKELWKNKVVNDQYEPGSTFKIFTSAMALEEGEVSLTEQFNCVGFLKKGPETIHCSKRTGHGWQTFKEGIANSCNPVFMTLGERVGAERFYNYITIFGLRDKTGVGLPGEQTGIHHKLSNLGIVQLAVSSFGQTFKITPMQLISGVCSVANNGDYMQPYIIKEIKDKNGNIIVSNSPEVVRQTVSKETSEILREYLEYAVEKGKKAYIEGYRIAGKTGTSEKIDEIEADGTNTKRIASFIGFAPADDPQICVLVVVDEPNSTVQYGSYIAAPLAKEIIRESLIHLNIEPYFGEGNGVADILVPNLLGKTSAEASAELKKLGLMVKIVGGEGTVNYQIPGDGNKLPKSSSVLLYTNEVKPNYTVTVPDILGKTAAECNQILVNSDLNIRIIGENISFPNTVAVKQTPRAGEVVDRATVVSVEFESIEPKTKE